MAVYAASANRYDAYVGRDREEMELEYKRRSDIYDSVKEYVRKSVEEGVKLVVDEFLADKFPTGRRQDNILIRRTDDIMSNLHEGNHVAYGVGRKMFDTYDKLGAAPTSTP